jgi:hypothetical protein
MRPRGVPRRVAHALVSLPRSLAKCSIDPRAFCACVVICVRAADRERIERDFRHTFCEQYSRASVITSSASSCARHRQGSPLRSDPLRGPTGLDDACAQLEGSTYVMAEEARCFFHIDPSGRQTYGEDLVGAITHPLRSRIRRGALQPSLSELRCSSFDNQLIDRCRRRHATSALIDISAPASRRRARAHSTTARTSCIEFAGVPMEFVERADGRPEPISIARCRELLGEAESMTDQEIAWIRRHADDGVDRGRDVSGPLPNS